MSHIVLLYGCVHAIVPGCVHAIVNVFMQTNYTLHDIVHYIFFRHVFTYCFMSVDYNEEENHFCILFPWRTGYATKAI